MSSQPPNQPGQLSPDGAWRWDGWQWVPVAPQGAVRPPPPRRTWIWWVAGGCALLLILAVIGGTVGAVGLAKRFQQGGFACLPSDFPSYPGATVTRENTYVGTGVAPGDTKECQETLESNDEMTTVTDFYTSHLDTGDWRIISNDSRNGVISFQRRSRVQTVGRVRLLGRGQRTVIEVMLDS
jgi:hypothetical protein